MEYLFKISARDEQTSIRLGDYSMVIKKGGAEEIVSYANVLVVRINRSSDHAFTIHITIDGHAPILVPSWSYSENRSKINQSTGYSLFVRVLHHHLMDKSKAVFKAGSNVDRIWQWAVGSAFVSFVISISADFMGFSLMNPYMQGLILSALFVALLFVFTLNKMPKTYHPTNIPLQFLP